MNSTRHSIRQKIAFALLLGAMPLCKGAADSSREVPRLELSGKQITHIPEGLNLPERRSGKQITHIPEGLNLPEDQ